MSTRFPCGRRSSIAARAALTFPSPEGSCAEQSGAASARSSAAIRLFIFFLEPSRSLVPVYPDRPAVQRPGVRWISIHDFDRPAAGGVLAVKGVAEQDHVAQVGRAGEAVADRLEHASRALRRGQLDAEVTGGRMRDIDADLDRFDEL